MKIAILTQPLGHNYGGLLQAYAMQIVLRELGVDAETLDRRKPVRPIKTYRDYGKYGIKKLQGRIKTIPTKARKSFVHSNLEAFRSKHLKMSPTLHSSRKLATYCKNQRFDGYLVGSDQVWRPRYSPCLPNFFLDFTASPAFAHTVKISYAASFGVDQWEFSDKQTSQGRALASEFTAISVREKSAVTLCREHLGVKAEWVLDPTMLLSQAHYEALISKAPEQPKRSGVFCYVLDESSEKRSIISAAETLLGKETFTVKPRHSLQNTALAKIDSCRYPAVEAWLQGVRDSDFVLTDSFHGTAFAILFNKPFLAIGNPGRGLSRFQSLLGLLGLEERLITSKDKLSQALLDTPIDWPVINQRLESAAKTSKAFLASALAVHQNEPEQLNDR
ncbi:polysaccharide pyruvyl transferase family protein [Marinobacter sp. SS21]|uniref:polysaccharide pyruvyl transferase family protein n=1 Tax=Marinobacter sp. SS21 TaxID=2979460 RepID=UPI00232F22EE|nr:polysaccharide pyruvyl transferase family protein [Marinobacter sp. SS21]MDC0663104.1 polysaccharide pyruvyl transferase family protein [Marinobacter sp. SS21]